MEELKVSRCFDIAHELQKASIIFKTNIKNLTFNVVEVYTFLSTEEDGIKTELSESRAKEFFSSGEYEDNRYFVTQAYDLIIKKKEKKSEDKFSLKLERSESELYLVCLEENYEWLLGNLGEVQRGINAQKALLGVIFHSFSISFSTEELRNKLSLAQRGIGHTRKVLLEKSQYFSPLSDSYFYFTLKEDWEAIRKVCHENSSFAVKEGMEVGRFYKANAGSDGRNLKGEFIKNEKREPIESEFSVLGDDFELIEEEEYTLYKGKREGFVGQNSSGLILVKEMNFEEITQRNIGNLLGGLECGMEINVKASVPEKDAVGTGIIIEAQRVKIIGSVDQGAVIRSEFCSISGSVHQGAEIFAKEAEIGLHKGKLHCEQAKIKLCEGGMVDCGLGEFEELTGAEVYGKEISVKVMRGNNKVSISTSLDIAEMSGGANSLCIDSSAFSEYREEIKKIQKRHGKYLEAIDKLNRAYRQDFAQAKKMKPAVDKFRLLLAQQQQQGIQPQPYLLSTIGEYMTLCNRLKALKSKIENYDRDAKEVLKEIEPIAKISLGGRINCNSAWVQQNQVEFINILNIGKERLIIEDGEKVNIKIDPNSMRLVKERNLK
ncbi:FapA family protein [Helicobacter brantae]|uniref:DUF342 domain-containing protein n=1 Tax=Helicobacter brantae TaxID=375927 RepID=A0A3D8J217_9HELI|nr:FapA family protein [Helicobacter brantae]RDU71195.1 hypothetical protein CQA58_03525 [Helicobacter brantae]